MVNWPTGLLGYPRVKRVGRVSVDKPNSRPDQQGGGCCQTSLVTASQTQWAKCPLGYCASTVGNKLPWLAANDFSRQWCQRIELPLGPLLNSTVSFRQLCAFPGSFPGNSADEFLGLKLKSNSQLCWDTGNSASMSKPWLHVLVSLHRNKTADAWLELELGCHLRVIIFFIICV